MGIKKKKYRSIDASWDVDQIWVEDGPDSDRRREEMRKWLTDFDLKWGYNPPPNVNLGPVLEKTKSVCVFSSVFVGIFLMHIFFWY